MRQETGCVKKNVEIHGMFVAFDEKEKDAEIVEKRAVMKLTPQEHSPLAPAPTPSHPSRKPSLPSPAPRLGPSPS